MAKHQSSSSRFTTSDESQSLTGKAGLTMRTGFLLAGWPARAATGAHS